MAFPDLEKDAIEFLLVDSARRLFAVADWPSICFKGSGYFGPQFEAGKNRPQPRAKLYHGFASQFIKSNRPDPTLPVSLPNILTERFTTFIVVRKS